MPKVVDHEVYREELLRASFEIVAKVGYGTLSMKQLAQSMNISVGLIYHYFKNKEDWFVSLVVHFSKETFDRIRKGIPSEASRLEKIRLLALEMERNRDLYASMIRVATDFSRMQQQSSSQGMFQIGMALSYLYQQIALRLEIEERQARAVVSYLGGVILAARLDPQGFNTRDCIDFMRKLLDVPESAPTGETA